MFDDASAALVNRLEKTVRHAQENTSTPVDGE